MREYIEFLTDRELYVLQNHPAMSYKQIGEVLGISQERVRQLKVHALRSIRDEQRCEQAKANGRLPVQLTLQRRDVWIIIHALREYQLHLIRQDADLRRKKDPDGNNNPWRQRLDELIELLQSGYSQEPFLAVISSYPQCEKNKE